MIEFIRIYHSATSAPRYIWCVCVPPTLKALDIQLIRVQLLKEYRFVTQEDSYICIHVSCPNNILVDDTAP